MVRLLIVVTLLAGATALPAQELAPADWLAGSRGVPARLEPIVRIGIYLQEQTRRDWPQGPAAWPGFGADLRQPWSADAFLVQSTLNPLRAYTVRSQPGDGYTLRNGFNPLESYTVTLQPLAGFRIQSPHPTESYRVSPRPWDGYTVQHNLNPLESYTVRSQPFDGFQMRYNVVPMGRDAFWQGDFAVPGMHSGFHFPDGSVFSPRPFDGYGFQYQFTVTSHDPFSSRPFSGPSIPNDLPRVAGFP